MDSFDHTHVMLLYFPFDELETWDNDCPRRTCFNETTVVASYTTTLFASDSIESHRRQRGDREDNIAGINIAPHVFSYP